MEQGDILIDHGLDHLWMSMFGFDFVKACVRFLVMAFNYWSTYLHY